MVLPFLAIAAVAAPLIGGLIGGLGTGGGKKSSRKASAALASVKIPTLEELTIELERAVLQGQITPLLAQQALQEASQLEEFEEDPIFRGAQLRALEGLQDVVDTGGLTATTRANLAQIAGEQRATTRGAREAALANARARGISGSGIELAGTLAAGQQAVQTASQRGLEQAALGERARREALIQLAQTGTTIRGQEFGQAATRAASADAISRFNVQLRSQTDRENINRQNAAQAFNLAERQRLSEANVATAQREELFNRQLPLKVAELDLRKQGAIAGVFQNRAQLEEAAKTKKFEAFGSGIASAGSVLGKI